VTEPVDWAALARYFAEECSSDERAAMDAWIAANPHRPAQVEALRAVWTRAEGMPTPHEVDAAWTGLVVRMTRVGAAESAASGSVGRTTPSSRGTHAIAWSIPARRAWIGSAVAATILLAAGVGAFRPEITRLAQRIASPEAGGRVYATGRGERDVIRLTDGTQIVLGPASRLTLAPRYRGGTRSVSLEGTALFSVWHDAAHPFVVRTARTVTEDLGTSFVVRDYATDAVSRVAVREGHVRVTSVYAAAGADRDRPLQAGDAAIVAADARGVEPVTADAAADFDWADGRFTVHDVRLADLLPDLARSYDIDITLADPALGDQRVSATWANQGADQILADLGTIVHAHVEGVRKRFVLVPDTTR
jgi:ferric-dicitrate binding protein FerR (iron transport regulator)